MSPRIAIIYDRINKFGGAERVLIALKKAFPNAVFFTSVYDRQKTPWTHGWDIRTSFLGKIPFIQSQHDKLALLMPVAFESLDLSDFDIVISVTSEAAKGVITSASQLHICYCLTPTRYLWSHTHEYEGRHFQWLKRLFFHKLRHWDYMAGSRPDHYIAISKRVKKRIEKYYRREVASIIYPPVSIEVRGERLEGNRANLPNLSTLTPNPYFLVVSRLIPYKRVDLAIKACIEAQRKLVIVGTGSDENHLRQVANNNPLIEFVGFIPEDILNQYYAQATALICPQEEDFGIISLEAQAHGIPVITYENSGVFETIVENKTGISFAHQTTESLIQALQRVDDYQWDKTEIQKHVTTFSLDSFVEQFQERVKAIYQKKEMMLYTPSSRQGRTTEVYTSTTK